MVFGTPKIKACTLGVILHIVLQLDCSSLIDTEGTIDFHEIRLGYLYSFRGFKTQTKISIIVCIIKEKGFYIYSFQYLSFDENPKIISPSGERLKSTIA